MLQQWRKFQRNNIFQLLVLSALLYAIYFAIDAHIMQNILQIGDENRLIATAAYLSVGSVFGFFFQLILSVTPVGKLLDPDFTKVRQLMMRDKKAHRAAIVEGVIGAFTTAVTLSVLREFDPGIVAVLGTTALLFVAVTDSVFGFVDFRKIIWPGVLVSVGIVLITVFGKGEDVEIASVTFLVLFFVIGKNVLNAVQDVLNQVGITKTDATSYGIWRFFWLAVSGVTISVAYATFNGQLDLYLETVNVVISNALLWISVTMLCVFLSTGWKGFARKSMPNTYVNMVSALSGFFGILITWIINKIQPDTFKDAPADDFGLWAWRILGFLLILYGVYLVAPHVEAAKEKIQTKFGYKEQPNSS